jgi:hypothetical protein
MKLPLYILIAGSIAFPAMAQPVAPPAGPGANPGENAAIAHHDRKVARRAARHGDYRKAQAASHAANTAAAESQAPR